MIDKIERIAELEATAFGFTLEDLREDTFEELPTPLWGPSRAVWGVNEPDNANSLQKLVDGDADADVSEGLELAEALLAKAGQLESLDNVIAELEELQEPEFDIVFGPQALVHPSALPTRTRQFALSCEDLVVTPVIGRDVKQLSYYMSLANAATQELQDGTADQVDLVATVLGVVPHPAVKAAGILIGLAAFYRKSTTQIYANTLPSRLVEPELFVSREWFEEDSEEEGSWDPNDGVRGYEVSAESNGIDLTATMVVGLINAISSVMGAKGIKDGVVENGMKTVLNNWELAKDIGETGATEFIKAKAGDLEGPCTVGPRGWGPFNMSATLWSEVDYTLGIQAVQGNRWAYEPKAAETGYIEVKVPDGPFPPSTNVLASQSREADRGAADRRRDPAWIWADRAGWRAHSGSRRRSERGGHTREMDAHLADRQRRVSHGAGGDRC